MIRIKLELQLLQHSADIQRKAVAPKKGEEAESGFVARGLAGDEATRFGEMESRIMGLEEQLAMALDELRQARSREMGVLTLAREMIGHMAQVERGEHHLKAPESRLVQ